MGLLQTVLGDQQKQGEYSDFIKRYEQGAPHEGISPEEAGQRHDEVAGQLSPEEYGQAATEALNRMPQSDRLALGQHLQQAAASGQISHPELQQADPNRLSDAGFLGRILGMLHGQSPGMLGSLLGGVMGGGGGLGAITGMIGGGGSQGAGGGLSRNLSTGLLAGIAASAARRFMSSRR